MRWAWLAAASVALSLIMLGALLVLLSVKGLSNFWPATVHQLTLKGGETVIGVPLETRELPSRQGLERRYLTANRDDGGGIWRWLANDQITEDTTPEDLVVLERRHWAPSSGVWWPCSQVISA